MYILFITIMYYCIGYILYINTITIWGFAIIFFITFGICIVAPFSVDTSSYFRSICGSFCARKGELCLGNNFSKHFQQDTTNGQGTFGCRCESFQADILSVKGLINSDGMVALVRPDGTGLLPVKSPSHVVN